MSRIQRPTVGETIFIRLDRVLQTGEAAGMDRGLLIVVPNALMGETVKARIVEVHEKYGVAMR